MATKLVLLVQCRAVNSSFLSYLLLLKSSNHACINFSQLTITIDIIKGLTLCTTNTRINLGGKFPPQTAHAERNFPPGAPPSKLPHKSWCQNKYKFSLGFSIIFPNKGMYQIMHRYPESLSVTWAGRKIFFSMFAITVEPPIKDTPNRGPQ